MLSIHPQARTTPAVRQEIARSAEPTSVLAQRFGVSTETIRKWRKRGAEDCRDHSSRPTHLRWRATDEERAIVCHLRRMTGFALDDLTFTLRHYLPHLNRDSIYRILKAEGLGRLPAPSVPRKVTKQFKEYDLGFVHIDIKHLPKLHVIGSGPRKRYLYVAIDRASRRVHLAVKDEETEACATAFLREAAAAFPFKVVLTDCGSCFTADGFEAACRKLGIDHRKTKPYTPRTNGMVERFNGRIGARSWSCVSAPTTPSNACSTATIWPTTHDDSASSTVSHPIRSSRPVSKQNLSSPIQPTNHPAHATAPKPRSPPS
jgi:transposase InsO family protein